MVFTRVAGDGQTRTWIMSSSGGAPQRLNESATDTEYGAAWPDWSPNGDWITFLDQDDGVWNMFSPDGKTVRSLGQIASSHLGFSEEGKTL